MLYRTYRPLSFDQVVGQEHVIQTLRGALATGRTSHAYLFAGPRGTGKTTIARIYAKALNCAKRGKSSELPCNECDNCLAVNTGQSMALIEIDAASNRGIDEVRNIKESATVAALGGTHKVFLVDEVHMMTKDAFNALLKILEEPPAHVVFILATTEAHKILPTVLSRVQRFDFRKLTHKEIMRKLRTIADAEKVKIDDEALMALAIASDGAVRDAEVAFTKALSSLSQGQAITADYINEALGLIPLKYHPEFLGYLTSQDRAGALSFIQKAYSGGIDLEHFSKEFLEYVRKVLIAKINPATLAAAGQDMIGEHGRVLSEYAQKIDQQMLIRMILVFTQARANMRTSPIPQLPLELAVMELVSQ